MATVTKNFRIKSGLIVEGTSGTINGHNILTESTSGDQYILNLVGGATLVKSVDSMLTVDGSGKLTINANTYDAYGSASAAQSAAATDATNKANAALSDAQTFATNAAGTAETNANTYTNNTINALTTADIEESNTPGRLYFTDTRAQDAISAGTGLTKENQGTALGINRTTVDSWYDAAGSAATAESNANTYADNKINDASNATDKVWSAYKTSTEIGLAQSAAEAHADAAVANIVGLAPQALDTLEELATALENNPDIIANLESVAAGKQDALTPGNGIVIDENLIYVPTFLGSGVSVTPTAVEIDRAVVDAWYDASGAAATAQTAAASDATNKANAAEQNAKDYADDLAVNYDAAGTASAAQAAAETAAQNALNDVLSGSTQFTEVAVDWMVKHVASYAYASTDAQTVAYSWNKNKGASAKFLVRIKNGSHSQVSEVLVTRDDSDNIAITEYGIVTSNGILGDITATMNGNNVELKVTPEHANGSEIFVSGTLMAYTD